MNQGVMLLVIVAPFVLAAAGLWIWERRKPSQPHRFELEKLLEALGFKAQEMYTAGRETHHPYHFELEKLLEALGFKAQEMYTAGREFHYPFRRGGDEVDCFSDGGSTDVAFRIQGQSTIVSYLSHETVAALIRDHPEILRGEFQALIAAENAARSQAKAKQAHS